MPVIATPVVSPSTSPSAPESGDGTIVCDSGGASGVFVRDVNLSPSASCYFDCTEVFVNIQVTPTIKQGTLVEWELHPNFRDPGPYEYQLQFSRVGSNSADDWEPVGGTAENVFFMIDDVQRVYGKTNWAHYRICLNTPIAQYFSKPISSLGALSFKDRRILAELKRAQVTMFRSQTGTGGVAGALLKRRLAGDPCSCLDPLTKEVTDAECTNCYGTGFAGGYYSPVGCVYAALERTTSHNNLDGGRVRGTVEEGLIVQARMLAVPQLFEEDLWINPKSDARWYLHQIQNEVEWRGIPVAVKVQLRLAPFTDPVYDIEVPDLLPTALAG